MKKILFPLLLVMGFMAHSQTDQSPRNWEFGGDFYIQNALVETTIGPESIVRSTNLSSNIEISRRLSKKYWIHAGSSAEYNWAFGGNTFTARSFNLGLSSKSGVIIRDDINISMVTSFSGFYKFLHNFKAPEGEIALKPDNGVFGIIVRFGFNINAGNYFFGPSLIAGLDFKEFNFSNTETLRFKEWGAIGFGFGFRF